MILMEDDFFQVLRRVQREERTKSSLSKIDNDFYKQLREYIKDLERSVANDPFGNEQLLLNNAQRIATFICEKRESKITKAANNNIYRSFLLFKRDNPQFDLLDTTPLNLTDEEEILYFSLMDALKNHRYRISLDEYAEDKTLEDDIEEEDEFDKDDDEIGFVEDSYESSQSTDDADSISDDLEDEISDALGEPDEVLDRLKEIKAAKVVTDEKYESIDKQVANQKYPSQSTESVTYDDVYVEDSSQFEVQSTQVPKEQSIQEPKEELQSTTQEPKNEVQPTQVPKEGVPSEQQETQKRDSPSSNSVEDIFKNPDSQFVDLNNLEPDYDDDFYNAISAGSNYAAPSEDDFNMIFAKPKKPKSDDAQFKPEDIQSNKVQADEIKKPGIGSEASSLNKVQSSQSDLGFSSGLDANKVQSSQSDLGFSSGVDVKEGKVSSTDAFNTAIEKKEDPAPKRPVDKTQGGLLTRGEAENTTVIISESVDEMVGVDGKVYGPFLENDVVILPNLTAQILINNNKATLVKL